jgi:hypothetical protein
LSRAQRLPGTLASAQSVNAAIVSLWTQGLPDDYYQQYAARIAAVKREDVLRDARQYVDVNHLVIVIVGDRSSIEGPLRATRIAPIAITDIEGQSRAVGLSRIPRHPSPAATALLQKPMKTQMAGSLPTLKLS